MVWTFVNLEGQTHFKLKVVDIAERRGTHTYWNCICECGNKVVVRGSAITSGKAKSCGCFRSESVAKTNTNRRNPEPWLAEMNIYKYHLSVDRPNRRGLATTWALTVEEYKSLSVSDCFYCGLSPSSMPYLGYLRKAGVKRSGIDRVDNYNGYSIENCVPCCAACNREKGTRTQEEFLESTRRRYFHLLRKGLIQTALDLQ